MFNVNIYGYHKNTKFDLLIYSIFERINDIDDF